MLEVVNILKDFFVNMLFLIFPLFLNQLLMRNKVVEVKSEKDKGTEFQLNLPSAF